MADQNALLRTGAKIRRAEIRGEIRVLQNELVELALIIGTCRKSEHCWQEDDHDGGCTDIRYG